MRHTRCIGRNDAMITSGDVGWRSGNGLRDSGKIAHLMRDDNTSLIRKKPFEYEKQHISTSNDYASVTRRQPFEREKQQLDQQHLMVSVERSRMNTERCRLQREKLELKQAIDDHMTGEQAVAKLALENERQAAEFTARCLFNAQTTPTECCICMHALRDTAMVPCGHKTFCYGCADKHFNNGVEKMCPICRVEVTTYMKIFG